MSEENNKKSVEQLSVAICTTGVYDPPLKEPEDYFKWTDKIKIQYCAKYNLKYVHSKENPRPEHNPLWSRFSTILYALTQVKVDWAIWMDCDAAPVNLNVDIRKFLLNMNQEKVIIQKDLLGFNGGVVAYPNTPEVISWLLWLDSDETYEHFKDVPFQDQEAMCSSIAEPGFYDKIIQEPDYSFGFNSYDDIYAYGVPVVNPYIEGKSWCLHIPGYGNCYRRIRFQKIYENLTSTHCPVCGSISTPYFTVPFDKTFYELSDEAKENMELHPELECEYHVCPNCEYIFSPFFAKWNDEDYAKFIYNDDYEKYVDVSHGDDSRDKMHEQLYVRPIVCNQARHLDYGCGRGGFSKILRDKYGLWSDAYDRFYTPGDSWTDDEKKHNFYLPGKKFTNHYSLITCFEVLEHVYDPHPVFYDFARLTTPHATVLLSTQLWDGNPPHLFGIPPEKWQNIAPRNGHVCMHSHHSIEYLCEKYGFIFLRDKSTAFVQAIEKVPYSKRTEEINKISASLSLGNNSRML